jgi:hypothetical protein
VKLTRLVVESANAVLAILTCQSSTADNSDDGSVLVDARKVKDARSIFSLMLHLLSPDIHHLAGMTDNIGTHVG